MKDTASILQAIHDEHGELTPELVVEAARPPDHPLHHLFTWDKEKAASHWLLWQARRLIRQTRFTVVVKSHSYSPPAYVAVTKTFQPTMEVDKEESMRRELAALNGHLGRIAALAAAWEMEDVKKKLEQLSNWINKR